MRILNDTNINFARWRWQAIVASCLLILLGVVAAVRGGGLPLGVDFSGGTIVVVQFEGGVSADDVRTAVDGIEGDKVVQQYGVATDNEWLIRLPQVEVEEQGAVLEQGAVQIVAALEASPLPGFEVRSTEVVGPVVGADLQRRGIYATVLALLGISLYITFRFRFSFAIGALVAVIHDLLVALTLLTLFGYELSLNVVAALLFTTGYSVNDTIVIFDRVRENLRKMRREPLEKVVNISINHTLTRTLITSLTTFVAVTSVFLFGGEVLRSLAFTLMVGVLSGTYSTIFIASSVAVLMSQQTRARARPGAPASAGAGGAPADVRPTRKARRAS
jgi:preprotein translocase SecF subunit